MIKAYLYPDLFDYGIGNDIFRNNPCRVEVEFPLIPEQGTMIVSTSLHQGVAEALFENCKNSLLSPNSTISYVLERVREDIENKNDDFLYNVFDWEKFKNVPNIELLEQVIMCKDVEGGFNDGIWTVDDVLIFANDDHVHITIKQEI